MEKIICPHCNKEVELSQALFHEVEEKISVQLKSSQKEAIEKAVREAEENAAKKFAEEAEFKLKNSHNENEELRKTNKELRDQLLELNSLLRKLNEEKENMKVEVDRATEKARKETQEKEEEKYKLEIAELEKKNADMQKSLTEAQRKGKQGSQQLQGEVLELDLESQLSLLFPEDEILAVPKGIYGADLIQKVRNKVGKVAGIIIWEAKRAKWSEPWIQKLKDDMIVAKANEAILVVEELPEKINNSGFINGVWVTSYKDAVTLANSVRVLLKKIAQIKTSEENKDEKLEDLYQFITSDNFKHRVAAHIETVIAMKTGLDSDKRLQERVWKRREVEINRVNRIGGIFDEMAAIAGTDLPLLPNTDIRDEEKDEDEELKLIT